ncbi:MAG: RAMP superfamily CRISPR-associated protein [Chitinophagales bacterium]|nr:RAMP superfamily CRISPR-associated protein [Chitinophagales bacterium]
MKLKITLQSYMLAGSGEGGSLIDTDIVFHKTGFPYLPGRRVKGLLKENLFEVMEMKGYDETEICKKVNTLFGKEGAEQNEGKLGFRNFYVQDWENVKQALPDKMEKNPFVYSDENIKQFYTTEIQQTAIVNGIAKPTSLRNYRVIKSFLFNKNETKPLIFEGNIGENEPLEQEEKELFNEAVLNFRYAGTRRNRGFGKIKCSIDFSSSNELGKDFEANSDTIDIEIRTLSPVVLSQQLGEKNTVFTEKIISGNRLRGLLASQYIKQAALTFKNAHKDDSFFNIFLSGKVSFESLYYNGSTPLPLHIHKYKNKKAEDDLVNVFKKPEDKKDEITKPEGGFGTINGSNILISKPHTTFFFHNSRPNRSAGKSLEEEKEGGSIFYYEALDEEQVFLGKIKGDVKLLNKLVQTIGNKIKLQIGRSRSAQYGEVELVFKETETTNNSNSNGLGMKGNIGADTNNANSSNTYLLILETPLILLNEYGEAEANGKNLLTELKKYFSLAGFVENGETKTLDVAAAFTTVEQYNAVWQSKSSKMPAYKEGSAFVLNLKSATDIETAIQKATKEGLGEYKEQGFGKIRFESYKAIDIFKKHEAEGNKPTGNNASVKILDDILAQYKQVEKNTSKKANAIKDAQQKKYLDLSNHLIGRMERMIETKATGAEVQNWIKDTMGKPAGEKLSKVGLVNRDHKFMFDDDHDTIYWLTFFRMLRKLKKLKEENNG